DASRTQDARKNTPCTRPVTTTCARRSGAMTRQGYAGAAEGRSETPVPVYDPQTALVIVDLQNDFADPAGSLSVAGGEEVIAVANRERARAREAGAAVVFTQDWHP